MVDFSRRNFLKGLGLGTVAALTLPKRIDVVAATLADLEQPPTSLGYACLKMETPFSIFFMDMHNPFNEDLSFRFFINSQAKRNDSVELARLSIPRYCTGSVVSSAPGIFILPESLNLPQNHKFELWVMRDGGRLPITKEVFFSVRGTFGPASGSSSGIMNLQLPIKNVRIDRTRAIELGISDPSEPIVDETEVTQSLFIN
jgi:hypothetical protein